MPPDKHGDSDAVHVPLQLRVLCEGAVETMGRMGFDGAVHHAFTAHPKVDPVTGELFFFG